MKSKMPSPKKIKLQRLLDKLQPFDAPIEDTFASLDKEIASVSARLKETITAKTLEDVNEQFKKLRKLFEPLSNSFEELKTKLKERDSKLLDYWNERLKDINKSFEGLSSMTSEEILEKGEEITQIKALIKEIQSRKQTDYTPLIEKTESSLRSLIEKLDKSVSEGGKKSTRSIETLEGELKTLSTSLLQVRELANNRLGGAKPLQINVNSSVMSTRYTDINLVSNTAILWSASDDNTYKRVNLTASLISGGAGGGGSLTVKEADGSPDVSSVTTIVVSNGTLTDDGGGQVTISTGGGGSGITRISSTISVSSVFANASQTDYVAFANVGIALTLPVASSGNLYTVKNMSGSSVLVIATEGVDEGASALIPSNYESLSFISNSSIWGVV